jgi:arylsulfatase A-like enzyme
MQHLSTALFETLERHRSTMKIMRIIMLWSFLAGLSCRAERPNVLWLVGEDMGLDLGCYGAPVVRTPNLDRLAREGTRFDRAFCPASICSPSRSAFNTGMYPARIRSLAHRTAQKDKRPLPDGVQTISQWFADAGYYTCLMGNPKKDFNFLEQGTIFQGDDWGGRGQDQPFFCLYNFMEPHRYGWDVWDELPTHLDPADVVLPPIYPDHPVMRQSFAKYLDFIMEMDRKVGLVLERLQREGQLDNTLIFFLGDNGRTMYRGKQWLYEEGLSVPLIARFPSVFDPGTVRDDLVNLIDLAPTSLALAGVPVPATMDGWVIAGPAARERPWIFGARDLCDDVSDPMHSVRGERFKYIRNQRPGTPYQVAAYTVLKHPEYTAAREMFQAGKLTPAQALMFADGKPAEELYDVVKDPWETRNLAADPEYREQLTRMRAVLDDWIAASAP